MLSLPPYLLVRVGGGTQVDLETDRMIQQTIRTRFKHCTCLVSPNPRDPATVASEYWRQHQRSRASWCQHQPSGAARLIAASCAL